MTKIRHPSCFGRPPHLREADVCPLDTEGLIRVRLNISLLAMTESVGGVPSGAYIARPEKVLDRGKCGVDEFNGGQT